MRRSEMGDYLCWYRPALVRLARYALLGALLLVLWVLPKVLPLDWLAAYLTVFWCINIGSLVAGLVLLARGGR